MRLNDEQEAHIALIQTAATKFREAKAREYEIARQQAESRIRSFEIELQKQVARGAQMKISYSQLAKRGMGVQNGTTAKAAADAGKQFIDFDAEQVAEPTAPEAPRYAFDASRNELTVTLQPADFDGKLEDITEPQSQTFNVQTNDQGVTTFEPIDEDWSHPVTRVLDKAEAIAFVTANTPK